eukprot:14968547-Alexandrium_andersonii.AAC.1
MAPRPSCRRALRAFKQSAGGSAATPKAAGGGRGAAQGGALRRTVEAACSARGCSAEAMGSRLPPIQSLGQ